MRITNSIEKAFRIVPIALLFILPSCALTHYKEGQIIDRSNYSFIGPSGSGWLISKEAGSTKFYMPDDNSRLLIMHVKAGFDEKNQRYENEEEIMSGWTNKRKADTDSVTARYNCLSNDTRNGIKEKNNSKIYFMHIIITGCNKGATNRGEAVYLLFPVNFSVRHEYFVFFLVLFKDREASYEDFDFSIITPIIDSFRIKYRG